MSTKTLKQTRLDLRINPEHKQLLEEAASLKGLSLSSYVLSNSLEIAKKDIESHQKLILDDEDRDLFLYLIENSPEPCAALRSAMKKFQGEYGN
ncbi:MAG: DUF1778 domain-containing protein [Cyanobacteria bacterium J06639_18]